MITTTSGLIAPVTDRSMMDTQDGTYVWEYSQEDCPDSNGGGIFIYIFIKGYI